MGLLCNDFLEELLNYSHDYYRTTPGPGWSLKIGTRSWDRVPLGERPKTVHRKVTVGATAAWFKDHEK